MPFIEVKTKTEAQALVDTYMRKNGSPIRVLGSVSGMTDAEFTACRRNGCDKSVQPFGYGGSDIGTIMGKHGARIELYNRLKYPEKYLHRRYDAATQHRFDIGHAMEALILKRFEYATGHTIVLFDWQLVNEDYPHFIANMDALYIHKETGELGIVEIKCPQDDRSQAPWKKMAHYGNRPGLAQLVPESYRYQCYGYLAATRLDKAVIVGSTGWSLKSIGFTNVFRLNPENEKRLMDNGERFIRNTARGIMPNENDTESLSAIIGAYAQMGQTLPTSTREFTLPDNLASAIKSNIKISQQLQAADEKLQKIHKTTERKFKEQIGYDDLLKCKKELDASIASAMGSHEKGVVETPDARYTIEYRNTTRRGFDAAAFQADHPDLYNEYYRMHKTKSRPVICAKEDL